VCDYILSSQEETIHCIGFKRTRRDNILTLPSSMMKYMFGLLFD